MSIIVPNFIYTPRIDWLPWNQTQNYGRHSVKFSWNCVKLKQLASKTLLTNVISNGPTFLGWSVVSSSLH